MFHRDGEITPVEFWKKYVGTADLEDYVCLVDDPRREHAKGKKIGIIRYKSKKNEKPGFFARS